MTKIYDNKESIHSRSFFATGSSKGSGAGRLVPGVFDGGPGEANLGDRRTSDWLGAGERERDRLLAGGFDVTCDGSGT